jgi:hypothetical protein
VISDTRPASGEPAERGVAQPDGVGVIVDEAAPPEGPQGP